MINYEYMSMFWDDSVPKDYLIETNNHSIQITNENLHSQTITINESLTSSDGSISFGDCEASSIRFKVSGHTTPLTGKWLYVYVTMPETTQFRFGRYKVVTDSPVDGNRYREIIAYDKIYFVLNRDYTRWYNRLFKNTPQMTIREFRNAFFDKINITQNSINLINDDITIKKAKVSKLSGRDILKAIGEVNGAFGHEDRDGSFSWKKLYESTPITISRSYVTDIEYEDYDFARLDRLEILKSDGTIGAYTGEEEDDDLNTYTVESNFILATLSDDVLQNVSDTLFEICDASRFRPVRNLELKGNPCLEVGDRISINTNQGNIITYILQRTIKGGQSLRDTVSSDSQEYYTQAANSTAAKIKESQYNSSSNYVGTELPENSGYGDGKTGDVYFKTGKSSNGKYPTHQIEYYGCKPTVREETAQLREFEWDSTRGGYKVTINGYVYSNSPYAEDPNNGLPVFLVHNLEVGKYKIVCDAEWHGTDLLPAAVTPCFRQYLDNWNESHAGITSNKTFTGGSTLTHYEFIYEVNERLLEQPVYFDIHYWFGYAGSYPDYMSDFYLNITGLRLEKIIDETTGETDGGITETFTDYIDGIYTKTATTGSGNSSWQEVDYVHKIDNSENSGLSYTRPAPDAQKTLSLTPEVMRAWVKADPPQVKRKFNQYCVRYTGKPDTAINIALHSNTGWLNKSIKKDSEGVFTVKSGGAVTSGNIEYCAYALTGLVSGQRYYFNLKCNFADGTQFDKDYTKGLGLVFNTTGTIDTDNWSGDPGTFDSESLYYSMPRKTSAFFANFDFVATAATMYMCVVVADITSGQTSSLTLSRFVISKTKKAYIRNFYLFDLEQNDWLQYKPWGSGDESGEGGASTLADLDDVNFDNIQNGQSLYYDSTTGLWKNGNPPIASASTLGGIKVGQNLSIDANGVLSATGGGGGTAVIANPTGTPTEQLQSIQIGNTIYSLPSGGGNPVLTTQSHSVLGHTENAALLEIVNAEVIQ